MAQRILIAQDMWQDWQCRTASQRRYIYYHTSPDVRQDLPPAALNMDVKEVRSCHLCEKYPPLTRRVYLAGKRALRGLWTSWMGCDGKNAQGGG